MTRNTGVRLRRPTPKDGSTCRRTREKYGEKYHVVEYTEKIELIPIAADPLAAARSAAGELRDASREEIADAIADRAERDAARNTDE